MSVEAKEKAADPFYLGTRYRREKGPGGEERIVAVPLRPEDLLFPQEGDHVLHTDLHSTTLDHIYDSARLVTRDLPGYRVLIDMRVDFGVDDIEPLGPDISVFADLPEFDPTVGTCRVADLGARVLLVTEITSPDTRQNDLVLKVDLYHRCRVPFYAIVDLQIDLRDREIELIGYRWAPDGYVRVPLQGGRLLLDGIDLSLAVEDDRVVCYNGDGQQLPDYPEAVVAMRAARAQADAARAQADAAHVRAKAEADARRIAEHKLAEAQAELDRLKKSPPDGKNGA
jgi:hypothetical protein